MALHPRYPHVFSPVRLGPVEVPNRYYFAPHGSGLVAGTKPLDDLIAYSVERVRGGGCGMVVLALALHERGRTQQPCPHPVENIAAFRAYADALHEAGAKVFGQTIYHWTGVGRWQPLGPPGPALGPSVRQFAFGGRVVSTRAMSRADIAGMVRTMRETAANMREAGFDGIMLHGSHAALIEQFLSPWFNAREDEYGGSLENRLRFAIEMLEAAREGAGPDMAVGMRLNCDEQVAGGYDTEGAREIVSALCGRGLLDYIDLDCGMEPQQFHHGMPTGFESKHYYRPFVAAVRSAAGDVPVLSVLGNITTMAEAEEAIASGLIAMAGSARQLIAEPRFVQNARDGREAGNRTCIACNWCTAAGGDGAGGCSINPASYRERSWGVASFTPAATRGRVVVIGGGPGGMEAARVAALRGHAVSLIERQDRLGGAMALWASLPGRGHYGQAIDWWVREMDRLGVSVRLGEAADAAGVLALEPDAVIVATGARYCPDGRNITSELPIPGANLPHVHRPEAILEGRAHPRGKVIVLDGEGYHTGSGIAEKLAGEGAAVQLVTPGHSPVSPRNTDNWEERYIMARLKQAGVGLHRNTWMQAIEPGAVTLFDLHTGQEWREPADAVILATARLPVDGLARALEGRVPQLFTIGDALSARMLAAATYEGQKFARLIGEPGAPSSFSEAWFGPDGPEAMMLPADMRRPA